jgi:hypothetical protein
MFIACPHCRELVASDPHNGQAPALCPRCGGALPSATGTAPAAAPGAGTGAGTPRSFVSLLRNHEQTSAGTPPVVEAVPPPPAGGQDTVPASATVADEGQDQAPVAADGIAQDAGAQAQAFVAAPAVATRDPETTPETTEAATQAPQSTPPVDAPATVPDQTAQAGEALAEPVAHESPVAAANAASPPPAIAVARKGGDGSTRGPSFTRAARTTAVHQRPARMQWLLLFALALLLVVQVLLADRARLASDAGWRPLLLSMCSVLRCSLPPWREPEAFVMLSRDVRPVAATPGTLQAQASFRNDARWAQPWPVLLLTLKDADGRTLGARALTPDDYLDDAADRNGIAAGQSAQIAVQLREPSANVVAYSFDFR